jgi:hypothetical protein
LKSSYHHHLSGFAQGVDLFFDGSLELAVKDFDFIDLCEFEQEKIYHHVETESSGNPYPDVKYLCKDECREYKKDDIYHQVFKGDTPH